MSRLFVRRLSTFPPVAAPGPSRIIGSNTAPQDVRRRRLEQPGAQRPSPLLNPAPFASGEIVFPPQLEDFFQSQRAKGNFKGSEEDARAAFLKANQAWRARIRGGQGRLKVTKDGEEAEAPRPESKAAFFAREGGSIQDAEGFRDSIIGTKVWLPNIQIRLMRNFTPPGEAYDPTIATFRVPPSMTKTDVRSYLHAVYGLEVTFIRTDQYVAPVARIAGARIARIQGSQKNYKRVVVGLTEPFHYPDDVEEMRAGTFGGWEKGEAQAEYRENVLNGEYALDMIEGYRNAQKMKMFKGWRWRASTHDNEGNTLRSIMERRAKREAAIAEHAARIAEEEPESSVVEGEAREALTPA